MSGGSEPKLGGRAWEQNELHQGAMFRPIFTHYIHTPHRSQYWFYWFIQANLSMTLLHHRFTRSIFYLGHVYDSPHVHIPFCVLRHERYTSCVLAIIAVARKRLAAVRRFVGLSSDKDHLFQTSMVEPVTTSFTDVMREYIKEWRFDSIEIISGIDIKVIVKHTETVPENVVIYLKEGLPITKYEAK